MIKILYEDNHLLAIEKPVNIPTNSDNSNDEDILSLCKEYLKEKYHKPGNVYLGLVQRLDRPVGGAMVFAKTSKAASRLSNIIRNKEMAKTYLAILDGIPDKDKDIFEDYLYKDKDTNMTHVVSKDKGKYSKLSYELLATKDNLSLVKIDLETGRSHQIRVQFASRNLPLLFDQRYNNKTTKGQIALWSYQLVFPHPTTKEIINIKSLPPIINPWDNFDIQL